MKARNSPPAKPRTDRAESPLQVSTCRQREGWTYTVWGTQWRVGGYWQHDQLAHRSGFASCSDAERAGLAAARTLAAA